MRLNLTGTVKSLGGRGVGVRGGSKALSLAAERERAFIRLNISEKHAIRRQQNYYYNRLIEISIG